MPNYSLQFKAMGSHMQVWLSAASPAAAQILDQVPDWFEEWEAALSRFRPSSDLCRLNEHTGEWTVVSPVLFDLVCAARYAAQQSNGMFNPLILGALEAAGYGHSFDQPMSVQAHAAVSAVAPWEALQLDFDRKAVCLPRGARLDLGGIAKGWAAQEAVDRLADYGACLVDAGGDLVAHGSPDESGGWVVSVPNLDESADLYRLLLIDQAAATSGSDYRQWQRDGQLMHHLIDPRTSQPSTSSVLRSTVIAPDAEAAVVWAKVSLLTEQFSEYPTIFVYRDGAVESNLEIKPL
ncbi:MAG TPA: FAD:protein FMN transferase [Phototrophicaceae bacterium]|nr:FAD:protein FMN transferase [Phototrophicaceae bacterium]